MKSALAKVAYDAGCMLAAICLFCGLWNVFLAYVGPSYEPSEGISREAAGACAFAFGIVLVVLLAGLVRRRGNLAASGVQTVLDVAKA